MLIWPQAAECDIAVIHLENAFFSTSIFALSHIDQMCIETRLLFHCHYRYSSVGKRFLIAQSPETLSNLSNKMRELNIDFYASLRFCQS